MRIYFSMWLFMGILGTEAIAANSDSALNNSLLQTVKNDDDSVQSGLTIESALELLNEAKLYKISHLDSFKITLGLLIFTLFFPDASIPWSRSLPYLASGFCVAGFCLGGESSIVAALLCPVIIAAYNCAVDHKNTPIKASCAELDSLENGKDLISGSKFQDIVPYVLKSNSKFIRQLNLEQSLVLAKVDLKKFRSLTSNRAFSKEVNFFASKYLHMLDLNPAAIAKAFEDDEVRAWLTNHPTFLANIVRALPRETLLSELVQQK